MSDQQDNNGGVLRVQFGPAPDPAGEGVGLPQHPSGVSDGSAFALDLNSGELRQHGGVVQVQVNSKTDPALGVMASARSPGGSRSAPITPHSVVDIPDGQGGTITTTVANAARKGFLKPNGNGGWQDTAQTGEQFAKAATIPDQPAELGAEHGPGFLPEMENAIEKVGNSLPFGLRDAVERELAMNGVERTVAKFAAHASMPTEDLRATLQFIQDGATAQIIYRLSHHGLDQSEFPAFVEYVNANHAGEARSAMMTQAATRRASAYDGLIAKYQQAKARGGR